MDHIVKNIMYPNMTMEAQEMADYYAPLAAALSDADHLPERLFKINRFNRLKQLQQLALRVFDRTTYGMAITEVNAWYQPNGNSITLPVAFLRAPFYDPAFPAAVNFGALGSVVGHELVHGFGECGSCACSVLGTVIWWELRPLNNIKTSCTAHGFINMPVYC